MWWERCGGVLRLLAVSAVAAVSTWALLREGRVWALAQREGRKSNQGKWVMEERVGGDGVSFSCCAPNANAGRSREVVEWR